MAIKPETQYPGKIAPATQEYPYGAARNVTAPGDGTGTPWEAAIVNDLFGWQQALLTASGEIPTGTPETAINSQYLIALSTLMPPTYATVADMQANTFGITLFAGLNLAVSGGADGSTRYVVTTSTGSNTVALPGGFFAQAVTRKSPRFVATLDDDGGTPDAGFLVDRTQSADIFGGHSFMDRTVFDPPASGRAHASYDAFATTEASNGKAHDHIVDYQARYTHPGLGQIQNLVAFWDIHNIQSGGGGVKDLVTVRGAPIIDADVNLFESVQVQPTINASGDVTNYTGVKVYEPLGAGAVSGTVVGVYVQSLAKGAVKYPIFIELQDNWSYIGSKTRFDNTVDFEGLTVIKDEFVPDTDRTRDNGRSDLWWKQLYASTSNNDIINLTPYNAEPSSLNGSTIAMSDGTASTNGFGTSGEGLYRKSSGGAWVLVG